MTTTGGWLLSTRKANQQTNKNMSTGMTADSSEMCPEDIAEFGRKKAFREGNDDLMAAVEALEEAIENGEETKALSAEVESYF